MVMVLEALWEKMANPYPIYNIQIPGRIKHFLSKLKAFDIVNLLPIGLDGLPKEWYHI